MECEEFSVGKYAGALILLGDGIPTKPSAEEYYAHTRNCKKHYDEFFSYIKDPQIPLDECGRIFKGLIEVLIGAESLGFPYTL